MGWDSFILVPFVTCKVMTIRTGRVRRSHCFPALNPIRAVFVLGRFVLGRYCSRIICMSMWQRYGNNVLLATTAFHKGLPYYRSLTTSTRVRETYSYPVIETPLHPTTHTDGLSFKRQLKETLTVHSHEPYSSATPSAQRSAG